MRSSTISVARFRAACAMAVSLCLTMLGLGTPAGAADTWSRGIDEIARGTFWEDSREAIGLVLTLKRTAGAWPAVGQLRGEVSLGEIRIPGAGTVTSKRTAADWTAAEFRFEIESGGFDLRVSHLSPAWLIRTKAPRLVLFAGARKRADEAPSHMAVPEGGGVKSHPRGNPWQGSLDEPFVLVWFHDSQAFIENQIPGVHGAGPIQGIDVPMLVMFQNKPKGLHLSREGLEIDGGSRPLGLVQMMPLYGIQRLRRAATADWRQAVPPEVIERCRRFTRLSRCYPIECREDYSLGDDGAVRIRQAFEYLQIKDEWGTAGETMAPLAPTMGITLTFGRKFALPLEITPAPVDLEYFTPHGPLWGCAGRQQTLCFRDGLKYVNETLDIVAGSDPISTEQVRKINAQVSKILKADRPLKFLSSSSNYQFFRYGAPNEQIHAICQVVPFLDGELLLPVKAYLRPMMNDCLDPKRYSRQKIATPTGERTVARLPGVKARDGDWEQEDLSGGLTLSAAWSYGCATGDWKTLKQHKALLDEMANYLFVRHNWLLGFELDGWSLTGFAHTAQVDALVAYARLMRAMGDQPAYGKAAYLATRHLLSWYAHFFGTDYMALYLGRDHTPGANRFRHLVGIMPEGLAGKTDIIFDTKVTCWTRTHGPSPEGDPTLFLAPWTGLFPLAHDEMVRFWRDHMKGEIGHVWDFFLLLWPETFNQFSADEMNNWGGITPYYQLKAFVLDGRPQWLVENLPWPEVTQDPFYLENLRAILFSSGKTQWVPIRWDRLTQ